MRTTSYTIVDLLKQIRQNQYLIPQFQRDFVWNVSQVKLLIDSIANNYPLGSLLTLTKNSELSLLSRPINAIIETPNDDGYVNQIDLENYTNGDRVGVQYILDGQQRLTSIARVFLNANPTHNYYFDLKIMYETFRHNEDTQWIIHRKRDKKGDPERKKNGRFLRSDVALDSEKTDVYVSEYFEDSEDFTFQDKKSSREASAQIKKVFETIRNYNVPIVVLDRDAGIDSICRIFETINSTGTKLTLFDLAVAKYFNDINIKERWEISLEDNPILKEFEVEGERVLQVLGLWSAYEKRSQSKDVERSTYFEIKRKDLLNLDINFIRSNWDEAIRSLATIYQWVKSNGTTPKTLTNQGLIVSIAAFKIVCADFWNKPLSNFNSILKRWYFSKIMRSTVGSTTNYVIGQDFQSLVKFAENDAPLKFEEIELTISSLIELNKPQDSLYKAIQCVLRMNTTEDFWSGISLSQTQVEDHHIFPASLAKSKLHKAQLDSIANKLIVSDSTNRFLSNTKPEIYFGQLKEQHKENGTLLEADRRLRSCFIPYSIQDSNFTDRFQLDCFNQFLNDRATLIYERISQILGDSLKSGQGNSNDLMEDE